MTNETKVTVEIERGLLEIGFELYQILESSHQIIYYYTDGNCVFVQRNCLN